MLEKHSWSHTPEGVLRASRDFDLKKESTCLASDMPRISGHCFQSSNADKINTVFCADDPITDERFPVVDSNSYRYPLSDISLTDNDPSILDNSHGHKESNDLFLYDWPDIGNFEDVVRSCDSTFGLGGIGNDDELSWLSPHTIEEPEDVLKSDFKFSCFESSPLKNMPEQHETSKPSNACSSVNDSNLDCASINCKSSFWAQEGDDPDAFGHLTFTNGSDAVSESKDNLTPKEQGVEINGNGAVYFNFSTADHSKDENSGLTHFQRKQTKHHCQSQGKRKDRCLDGGLLHHNDNLRVKGTKLPSGDPSRQAFTSTDIQKQKSTWPASFHRIQAPIPYMHGNYTHPSEQIPVSSTTSRTKSGSSSVMSRSQNESSYASNQVQSLDRSLEAPARKVDDKREKLLQRHGFRQTYSSNPNHVALVVQSPSCNPISVPKHIQHSQNEVENHSSVEGNSIRTPTDLNSSNEHESSCMSSRLDEMSLEASSFHQLRQVMEQLDIRTKMCIRDSLYRLARSAEQRHHYANLNGGSTDDNDINGALMAEGNNECNGYMDIETDTNPIDRSIAHLLFHRPSDKSLLPAHDGLSLKSHTTVHGSITSSPVKAEKLGCTE